MGGAARAVGETRSEASSIARATAKEACGPSNKNVSLGHFDYPQYLTAVSRSRSIEAAPRPSAHANTHVIRGTMEKQPAAPEPCCVCHESGGKHCTKCKSRHYCSKACQLVKKTPRSGSPCD
ncbi:hypothetical protein M885DRAFT_575793 [Pelagophyceae sp. CCMP2097]|nr:hypothetical protein M885DRAFT_575793 [Pelagophyceae sp. CCMP2097]